MTKLINSLFNISYIEELSRRDIWINKIRPEIKLFVTVLYILGVTSVGKYAVSHLIWYMAYPVLILSAVHIPLRPILPKMAVPVLMGASLGVLNPIFDQNMVRISAGFILSAGWISFLALFIKSVLCILSALILISTTPVEDLAKAFRTMKLPEFMVIQFLLMFRYITILVEAFERALTAYSLRSGGKTSLAPGTWGSFVGQIFIRASDRSVQLYESMKLRGFRGSFPVGERDQNIGYLDMAYLIFWCLVFGGQYIARI